MKRIKALYLSQPDIVRKAERDFLAAFVLGMAATGLLTASTPDYHAIIIAVRATAGLALWRVVRTYWPSSASS